MEHCECSCLTEMESRKGILGAFFPFFHILQRDLSVSPDGAQITFTGLEVGSLSWLYDIPTTPGVQNKSNQLNREPVEASFGMEYMGY